MSDNLRVCSRCILDENIPNIEFDEMGVCNYCRLYDEKEKQYPLGKEGDNRVQRIIEEIKSHGKGKKYDCIIGVSGGVDSTYVLYAAVKLGLRPLAVHFDNHWDSQLAIDNIKKALDKHDIDLYTHTVDWDEFRSLQISLLKASVPDVELLTDKAIVATWYLAAEKYGIHYVISGGNFRTEGIIPRGWTYWDNRYFRSINKRFGKTHITSYPLLPPARALYYRFVRKVKVIRLLNYVVYNKKQAVRNLEDELGWCNYGGKHYESIFTRWFQSYYLPVKFGIDKRKVHLSALINSGQLTREQALEEVKKPTYAEQKIKEDTDYVREKLGLSQEEFKKIMNSPPRSFLNYPSYYPYKNVFNNILRQIGINLKGRP